MTNHFRCIGLLCLGLGLGLVLSNCASRPAVIEMLTRDAPQAEPSLAAEEEPKPVRRAPVRRAAKETPSASGEPARGAANPDPFTPDWYAREKAEADRMNNLTNICRQC